MTEDLFDCDDDGNPDTAKLLAAGYCRERRCGWLVWVSPSGRDLYGSARDALAALDAKGGDRG